MDSRILPSPPANSTIPPAPLGQTPIYPLSAAGELYFRKWLIDNQDETKEGRFMNGKAPHHILWRKEMVDTTVPPLYFPRRVNGSFKRQSDINAFLLEAMNKSDYWKDLPQVASTNLNFGNEMFNALSLYLFEITTKWNSTIRKTQRRNMEAYLVNQYEEDTRVDEMKKILSFQRHYRHTTRGLVTMYAKVVTELQSPFASSFVSPERAEQVATMLLFGSVKVHNDIVENFMARQCLGTSCAIMAFVALFFAENNEGEYLPIEGIGIYSKDSEDRPSLRTFIEVLEKLSLNHFLQITSPEQIFKLLENSYPRYRPLLAHARDFLDVFKTEPMQYANVVKLKRG